MISLIAITLIAAAGLFASAVRHVPMGQVYSVYRQGKPARLLSPGRHVVMPLVERVRHRIDLGGQVLSLAQTRVGSRDVAGKVYWQVLEPERADAVIEDVEQLIRRGAMDAFSDQADGLSDDRTDLGMHLKQHLNGALRQRGMMVTRVELNFA